MTTTTPLEITLPALHDLFYELFDEWRKENKDYAHKGGVYTLYAEKNVNRVLGVDANGILYIGKGDILSYNNRIGLLINALSGGNQHEAGVRYNALGYRTDFPVKQLKVHIALVENPERIEAEKLNSYIKQFGELPPLNRLEGKQ